MRNQWESLSSLSNFPMAVARHILRGVIILIGISLITCRSWGTWYWMSVQLQSNLMMVARLCYLDFRVNPVQCLSEEWQHFLLCILPFLLIRFHIWKASTGMSTVLFWRNSYSMAPGLLRCVRCCSDGEICECTEDVLSDIKVIGMLLSSFLEDIPAITVSKGICAVWTPNR